MTSSSQTKLHSTLFPASVSAPGAVALAALGQVALVANSRAAADPLIWRLVSEQPLAAIGCLLAVVLLSVVLSGRSDRLAFLIRQGTLGLIALSLLVIAGDFLNFIAADQQPWISAIRLATGLVAVGGLASLIALVRNHTGR